MKKILLLGMLLCGYGSMRGALSVTLDANTISVSGTVATIAASVTITSDSGDDIITENWFRDQVRTEESNNAINTIIITSSLTLPDVASIVMNEVTSVGVDIICRFKDNLISLTMNGLTTVGDDLLAYSNTALTTLSVPFLTTVGGNLSAYLNTALTTLSVPSLTTVEGNFTAYSNTTLTTFSLPSLTSIGGNFTAYSNTTLTTFSLPSLTSIGGNLWINDNPVLEKIPFNLFDDVVGTINTSTTALPKFISDLPEGADKTALTGTVLVAVTAAAALKRNPQVTVNVSGKSRSLNTHVNTNYDNGDGTYSQKKHGFIGSASSLI